VREERHGFGVAPGAGQIFRTCSIRRWCLQTGQHDRGGE
jgi:hypothetical protein